MMFNISKQTVVVTQSYFKWYIVSKKLLIQVELPSAKIFIAGLELEVQVS